MMPSSTRRGFLASTSLAAAGITLNGNRAFAQLRTRDLLRFPATANDLFPDPMLPSMLRDLATHAIDVAKSAGATYADIRLSEWHTLKLDRRLDPFPGVDLGASFGFGVRVLVDGCWTFAHGTVPTRDSVARAAQHAVTTAREGARLTPSATEWAPLPAVRGEWATPIQLDPFTVPVRDQAALIDAYSTAVARVHGAAAVRFAKSTQFRWRRDVRVFASSEGALTTQSLWRSSPFVPASGTHGGAGAVQFQSPRPYDAAGGYETVTVPGLQDELKALAEEAVRLASLRRRPLDIGRYPMVVDGATLGVILGSTLGPALEVDRVLGDEADASGTSFLGPANAYLNTTIASPLLTITGHRALPTHGAVQWDDEGTVPATIPVLKEGRLLNYFGSRRTTTSFRGAGLLDGIGQSMGCLTAEDADAPVQIRAPHLTVAAASMQTSLEELCKPISRGLLVRGMEYLQTDQQLGSGVVNGDVHANLFEIERGRIVGRVAGSGIQFMTAKLIKAAEGLGGSDTMQSTGFEVPKGMPWRWMRHTASAPAAVFKEVNVVSLKVRL